jgi:hypothetical protein
LLRNLAGRDPSRAGRPFSGSRQGCAADATAHARPYRPRRRCAVLHARWHRARGRSSLGEVFIARACDRHDERLRGRGKSRAVSGLNWSHIKDRLSKTDLLRWSLSLLLGLILPTLPHGPALARDCKEARQKQDGWVCGAGVGDGVRGLV